MMAITISLMKRVVGNQFLKNWPRLVMGILLMIGVLACEKKESVPSIRVTGSVQFAPSPPDTRLVKPDIIVYEPNSSFVTLAKEDGTFVLDGFGVGEHRLVALADGYASTTVGVITIPQESSVREYVLTAVTLHPLPPSIMMAGSLVGIINSEGDIDASSLDWSRCAVELNNGDGGLSEFRVACNAEGVFKFWAVPPHTYQLTVYMDGFAQKVVPVTLKASEDTSIMLTLEPIDPDFVRAMDAAHKLPPQAMLDLVKAAPSSTAGEEVVLEEPPPPTIEDSEVTQTATLRGSVIKRPYRKDATVSQGGITVAVLGTPLMVMTDEQGNFEIQGISAGRHVLHVSADGYEAVDFDFELDAGDKAQADPIELVEKVDVPRVVECMPKDGAQKVILDKELEIRVRFNQKMRPETIIGAVTVNPNVATRVEMVSEDVARIVLSGSGANAAKFNTRYDVSIGTSATNFDGVGLKEPFKMSLTTGGASVVRVEPTDPLRLGKPVVVYFNTRMNESSLKRRALKIQPKLSSDPIISVYYDVDSGWSRMAIQGIWEPNTTYQMEIGRGALDASRRQLSNTPYAFTISTVEMAPRTDLTNGRTGRK